MAGRVGAGTKVEGSEEAPSRPPLAITTATYGRSNPKASVTIATGRSTFQRTAVKITARVLTDIEIT